MQDHPVSSFSFDNLRNNIWIFGIPSWIIGITDRSFASFTDGSLSSIELIQLFTASFFFLTWLCLKPESNLTSRIENGAESLVEASYFQDEILADKVQNRMLELQDNHLIRQEYTLPFPYICQIYHLLNLKHLEKIHSFSLNNLRVVGVSEVEPTPIGGTIRFKTVLESPVNSLRIWRQPFVEAELTLHTPYAVELCIPVYNDRRIIVLFNVLPLNFKEHKFLIDIYSNLEWPRPILQLLLHCAAGLTLFEDLPYLRKLAEINIGRLVNLGRVSNHETMWLFRRFVDLYGAQAQLCLPEAQK